MVGGHVFVVAGARTEDVARLVVASAEPGGRPRALEAAHGPMSAFGVAVVLFRLVQAAAGPVPHASARLGADCPGGAVVTVRRDPVRGDARDGLG